jgi:Phosphotransferase enzyme family
MVMSGSRIPRNWEFTPEWMTPIIARRHPGVRLSAVRLLDGSDGTSSRARLGLEYAEGSGPESVFAKTQGDWAHRLLHVMTGNLYREALLFASGVPLPVEHPREYHGSVDRLRLNELVIMEDLSSRGVVLNDATRPLSVDDVANGLRGLARLHSAFWRFSGKTYPTLSWAKPWKVTWTFQLTLRRACGAGIANLKDSLPAEVAALGAKGMEQWWSRYIRTVSCGPMTLLHGDAHVGNTYLVPNGDLGFLDWACVRLGNWAFDVGYFIVGALGVADCRAHEADLVEEYRRALDVPVEDLPSPEEAWLQYRRTPAYGLAVWVATGSSVNYQRREICSNLVHRYGRAFLDLDTRAALASLKTTQ